MPILLNFVTAFIIIIIIEFYTMILYSVFLTTERIIKERENKKNTVCVIDRILVFFSHSLSGIICVNIYTHTLIIGSNDDDCVQFFFRMFVYLWFLSY